MPSTASLSASRLGTSIVLVLSMLFSAACGNATEDAEGNRLPSDSQVVADITPNDSENVVDVQVVQGRSGELYLHQDTLVWTFDRGALIKRDAHLPEFPDAIVVVGGLARYQLVGDEYVFHRFLTTYNEYEGAPTPDSREVVQYVEDNLDKVFAGREHNILGITQVELLPDEPWTWHAPNSFTAAFRLQYRQRANNTTVEDRVDTYDIRFYRQAPDEPLQNLLATETDRSTGATRRFEKDEIDRMPTLRSGFDAQPDQS